MSKYYFINERGEQVGPVEMDELRSRGVTSRTYVWKEGMSDWVVAGNVPELRTYISMAPPFRQEPPFVRPAQPTMVKPNSWLWLGILTTIFCCLPFGIISIVYGSKVDTCWASGDYSWAIENSNKAKNWGIAAAVTSLGIYIIYFAIILLTGASLYGLGIF